MIKSMRLEEDVATETIPATFEREGLSEGCRHACIRPNFKHCPIVRTQVQHAAACSDRRFTVMFANELSCPKTAYAAWPCGEIRIRTAPSLISTTTRTHMLQGFRCMPPLGIGVLSRSKWAFSSETKIIISDDRDGPM